MLAAPRLGRAERDCPESRTAPAWEEGLRGSDGSAEATRTSAIDSVTDGRAFAAVASDACGSAIAR